jgi:hypothetical protein
MQFKAAVLAVFFLCLCILSTPVHAVDVVPFDPASVKTDSPVIITGYSFHGPRVSYVQLFNTSDEVVNLDGWQLSYKITGQTDPVVIASLHGLLKPSNYIVAADSSFMTSADFGYTLNIPAAVTANASTISLDAPTSYLPHAVTLKFDAHSDYWQRNISTSTGNYLTTFAYFVPPSPFTLYGGGLYEYPGQTGLQVSEILANPRACSPLDTAGDCQDYVKLYNPTGQPIHLDQFRLRSGYQGQTSTASNTFSLNGTIEPGHYAIIPASITNSGGFIWVEDAYGIKRYDNTVLEYPDASSDIKKGQAWAYDASDGQWKWTIQPTPADSPNVFPAPIVKVTATTSSTKPCREDQYRSEDTNRCRSLASLVTATPAPCDDDQERNPVTNRCRKIATAASQLAPCKEGQERNPDTNRCRNVVSSVPAADFAIEPIAETGKAFTGWWALGGIGTLAVGRGLWEWRGEMLDGIRKVGSFFTSGK